MVVFYDQDGSPIAYTEDMDEIYSFDGEPLAIIRDGSIFNYNGDHLGWIHEGWVIDQNGDRVFFTEDAEGGPVTPVTDVTPVKSVESIPSIPSIPEIPSVKPIATMSWSRLSGKRFFEQ